MPVMTPRLRNTLLTLSLTGLISLVGYEGYRRQAYDDGVGVQTVGYGSTVHADGKTPVKAGDTLTPDRALITLGAHVSRLEMQMRACIGPVPLAQPEWDAYVSLAYNIGAAAFCKSGIVRALHATPPDYGGACAQIRRWVYAGGKKLPGLVKRREGEYRLCRGADSLPTPALPTSGDGANTP
ncbi:MAG: lysozyme [Pseudomonadota bacterium]